MTLRRWCYSCPDVVVELLRTERALTAEQGARGFLACRKVHRERGNGMTLRRWLSSCLAVVLGLQRAEEQRHVETRAVVVPGAQTATRAK